MNIFKIFIIQKQLRNGTTTPNEVVLEEVLDFLRGYLWLLVIIFLPILGIIGTFSFTSLAGGPYGVAKFFFWLFFIIFFIVFLIFYSIYKKFKSWIIEKFKRK